MTTPAEHAATVRRALTTWIPESPDEPGLDAQYDGALESLTVLVALAERASEPSASFIPRDTDEWPSQAMPSAGHNDWREESEWWQQTCEYWKGQAERANELERDRDEARVDFDIAHQEYIEEATAHGATRERAEQLERALRGADDLLRRLDEWDVMNSTHDGPYWKREIAVARAVLDGGTATGEDALRLASHAFAQYALDTNDPPAEAVDDFVEGFKQEATLRAVVSAEELRDHVRGGAMRSKSAPLADGGTATPELPTHCVATDERTIAADGKPFRCAVCDNILVRNNGVLSVVERGGTATPEPNDGE